MRKGIVTLAIVGIGLLLIYQGTSSEEKQIKKRLHEIIELAEKEDKLSPLLLASNSKKVALFFSKECRIQGIPNYRDVEGRSGISSGYVMGQSSTGKVSVLVLRQTLTLDEDETSAEMGLLVRGSAEFNGDTRRDQVELTLDWEKIDGEWIIDEVYIH